MVKGAWAAADKMKGIFNPWNIDFVEGINTAKEYGPYILGAAVVLGAGYGLINSVRRDQ